MTVSLRPTDCTQLTAQGDCVPFTFNLLQQLCLAQAQPVMQAASVLMLIVLQWLQRQTQCRLWCQSDVDSQTAECSI